VPNGLDPADAEAAPTDFGRPTLLYAGGSYPGRDLAGVLRVLAERFGPGEDGLQLVVYGQIDRDSQRLLADPAMRARLAGRAFVRAPVPNAEIAGHTRGAAALLLLVAPQHPHGVPAKLLDYVCAGRPVLGYGPADSDAARLVARWGVGAWAERPDELAAALQRVATGALPYAPDAAALAPWSADHLASETAALLGRAVGGTSCVAC
jgi:hypothetical protein